MQSLWDSPDKAAVKPACDASTLEWRLSSLGMNRDGGFLRGGLLDYEAIVIVSGMKRNIQPSPCKRAPGRPTSYRPEYCYRVVELMAEGRSLDGCAALLSVHPDSLNEWQRVHPEFSVAVRAGRAAATAFWEGRLLDVAQGGSGNAQAIQWALRNRSRAASGWDHAHAKLEVSGPDGGAVQLQTEVTVIDARLLTPDQRNAFKQVLLAAQAQGELAG